MIFMDPFSSKITMPYYSRKLPLSLPPQSVFITLVFGFFFSYHPQVRSPIFCVPPTGRFSWRHDLHLMCSVYRPLPRCHQCTDVLRDDRKLLFHNCQTCCHMGRCPTVGSSRSRSSPAEQGGFGLQRPSSRGALHYKDLSWFAGHHLCFSPYLRQCEALVVFWLLLLFAHTFHHHLLLSDRKENPQGRESL